MSGIILEQKEKLEYSWIDITAKNAIPRDLASLDYPQIKPSCGLILNGRAASWIYSTMTLHYADKCLWVAIIYPNVKGAVVVVSNVQDRNPGDVIPTYFGQSFS